MPIATLIKGEGRFKQMLVSANSLKNRPDIIISKAYLTNETDNDNPYANNIDSLNSPIICNVVSFAVTDNQIALHIAGNLESSYSFNRAYLTNIHKDILFIIDFETQTSANVDITVKVSINEIIEVVV